MDFWQVEWQKDYHRKQQKDLEFLSLNHQLCIVTIESHKLPMLRPGLLALPISTITLSWSWNPQRLVPLHLSFSLSLLCFMCRPTFWTKVLIFLQSSASTISFILCTKFLFLWIIVVFYITGLYRV